MLLETYAAMLNRKIIVPSARSKYVAIATDYWIELFGSRIANIEIDEAWYLDRYKDVAEAIGNGVVQSAVEHYCQSGYFEHRMPYHIVVDPEWYIENYPDVKEAIAAGVFSSPQSHFEITGFVEGRYPFAGFELRMKPRVIR